MIASGKTVGCFACCKMIGNGIENRDSVIGKGFGRYKTAKREITNAAMVKIMMLVRDLSTRFVLVVAFLFGELPGQMLKRMERLKQHRKQYCNRKNQIDYPCPFFHQHKCKQRPKDWKIL